jgi:DNA mismatch endonuclease (patch repair protein)
MKLVRRRDTRAELAIRRRLWGNGLRYRVDFRPCVESRSRADIAFTRARVAVYIDGCFWHACPLHASWPKANADWWRVKIEENTRRDGEAARQVSEAGWLVLRFWEHEDPYSVTAAIWAAVEARGSRMCPRPARARAVASSV